MDLGCQLGPTVNHLKDVVDVLTVLIIPRSSVAKCLKFDGCEVGRRDVANPVSGAAGSVSKSAVIEPPRKTALSRK